MAKPRLPRTREEEELRTLGEGAQMVWAVKMGHRITCACKEQVTAERLAGLAGRAVRVPAFITMPHSFDDIDRYDTCFIPSQMIYPSDADKVEIAARQGAAPRDLALMRARLAGLTEEEIALLASP